MNKIYIKLAYYYVDIKLKNNKIDCLAKKFLKFRFTPIKNNKKFIESLHFTSKEFEKKDMVCLHKSLVACLLLRKENEIIFNIGLSKYNFEAHAWVKVDGEIVTDNGEYILKKYILIKEVSSFDL